MVIEEIAVTEATEAVMMAMAMEVGEEVMEEYKFQGVSRRRRLRP
jgi:hypothetical protein